ncbi:geranylgeranyl reductase family protein [Chloroflexota bacterium]
MYTKKDVLIVGAGPSGSQLACGLASLGYEVLVLERKAAAGDEVCCTGIISRECLETFAIDRNLVLKPGNAAQFISPSGKGLRLSRDSEVAYILDRPALNRVLANRAQEAGASYLFAAQVKDIRPEADHVRVMADCRGEDTVFEARAAVLATGFGSPLLGRLGLGHITDFVTGAQARVATNNIDEVEIYFNQALAPGGFAWLVPTRDGEGLAGLLARRQPELGLKSLLSRLRSEGKIASAEVDAGYEAIPLRPLPKTSTDRVLVIGEAAGQVKPTTGGGVYYGLLCADIARDCLYQAFMADDFSAAGLASYDRQWRARLGRELQTGYRLVRFYRRLSNQQIERLFWIMMRSDLPRFMASLETIPFDWHGALTMKLLKHLAINTPLGLVKALRKA